MASSENLLKFRKCLKIHLNNFSFNSVLLSILGVGKLKAHILYSDVLIGMSIYHGVYLKMLRNFVMYFQKKSKFE